MSRENEDKSGPHVVVTKFQNKEEITGNFRNDVFKYQVGGRRLYKLHRYHPTFKQMIQQKVTFNILALLWNRFSSITLFEPQIQIFLHHYFQDNSGKKTAI